MDFQEQDFKLADYVRPTIEEGRYTITADRMLRNLRSETFQVKRKFVLRRIRERWRGRMCSACIRRRSSRGILRAHCLFLY